MSRYRGGTNFAKPENALKRANELIAVGQKPAALQALHDVITSKRYRSWQKPLEQIMMCYVDLCVDMKKGRYAKDGLIHYRNICQNVNVTSLEEVIKYFLAQAHAKAEQAQEQADALALDVEDLEVNATPEELMLSYVSGDKSKDRTDRELVTPWFKFLWESYRNVLDILRNNSRLEGLYALAANKAFAFCLHYKRTTEFKRLCDILRNHLANLGKYREQRDRPDLNQPESLQLFLETRFEQLRVACELQLWQEAFRSVEDIQGLLTFAKKPYRREMAVYYARLTLIFTKSNNYLYNAYAWYKLFSHERVYNKKLQQSGDLQVMASCVVLSALSVLPYSRARLGPKLENENEIETDRALRMASILGIAVDSSDVLRQMSRAQLVQEVNNKTLMGLASEEARQIYQLLETDFNPLELCQKLQPLLDKLTESATTLSPASAITQVDYQFFRNGIERVAALKALQQLGGVYSVMRISHVAKLVPFMSFGQLEQLVAEGVKHGYLQAKLDHKNGTVAFGTASVESQRVASHLSVMARRLTVFNQTAYPSTDTSWEEKRAELVRLAREVAEKDHMRSLARKLKIEQRKEEAERQLQERERDEELKKLKAERMTAEAEEKRREEDRRKREMERVQKMLQDREEAERREKEEAAKKAGTRIELEKKINKMLKHMDHVERAKREEEAPLIDEAYEKQLQEDEEWHVQEQGRFAEKHKLAWETDIQEKQRLMRMWDDKEAFSAQVMERRAAEFSQLKAAHEARLLELKEMRRHERDYRRKQEYVRRCRLVIEEKRRKEEEEERRIEEERKERELEERRRKREEEIERLRKREEELEQRRQEEKQRMLAEAQKRTAAPSSGSYVPPSQRGGGGSGYVPPALRAQGGGGAEPPAADKEERWGRRTDAPPAAARDSSREPLPAREGGAYRPPGARDEGRGGGDAWRPSRPAGPGGWGPSGEDRERERRPEGGASWGPPRGRDGPPPPAGGGGSYRPPGARGDGPSGPPRGPPRGDAPPPRRGGGW